MHEISPEPFGRYTLTGRIARGGMAEIFAATQSGPGGFERPLVIKRILPQFSENDEFLEMFLDEARIAANISHPNVVQVHDFGEVDGAYYIAMERIVGPNLGGIVKAVKSLERVIPMEVAVKLCDDVAQGLHYAHTLNDVHTHLPLAIVHRDISTSNVLVTQEGVAKVLDFGIAKAANQLHKTATGLIKGKLGYMPPEQVRGKPLDGRADLYAVGVVLYRLLTNRMPFIGDSEFDLMQTICRGAHPRASLYRPDIPSVLDDLIERTLAVAPEDRFQTGRELCEAFDSFVEAHASRVSTFDIAEYLVELQEAYGAPLEEIGVPGSSKLSRAPEALTGPSSTGTTALLSDIDSAGPPSPAAPIVHGPTSNSSGRRVPYPLLGLGVLIVGAGVGLSATHFLGGTGLADAADARVIVPTNSAPAEKASVPKSDVDGRGDTKERARRRRRGEKAADRIKRKPRAHVDGAGKPESLAVPGKVTIIVKPWGRVWVDGTLRGTTPMVPLQLTAGSHVVRVAHPDSGRQQERKIVVRSGGEQVLRINLSATP